MTQASAEIAVTPPMLAEIPVLRKELLAVFPRARLKPQGQFLRGELLLEFLSGAEAAIVGLDRIDEPLLAELPQLKMIGKYGVGLDNIDIPACESRGIRIGWTAGLNRTGVAEMVLCNMIGMFREILPVQAAIRRKRWEQRGGRLLSGRTVGIIGVGFVGKEVVRLLQPFNCRILVNDIVEQPDYYQANGLVEATKEDIYRHADVITLHTPLDDSTHHLINSSTLRQMKRSAFLINAARGAIVCQQDLKRALQRGRIAGAALDVFEREPPEDVEFMTLPNLYCTAHTGGMAWESVLAMGRSAIAHVADYYGLGVEQV